MLEPVAVLLSPIKLLPNPSKLGLKLAGVIAGFSVALLELVTLLHEAFVVGPEIDVLALEDVVLIGKVAQSVGSFPICLLSLILFLFQPASDIPGVGNVPL